MYQFGDDGVMSETIITKTEAQEAVIVVSRGMHKNLKAVSSSPSSIQALLCEPDIPGTQWQGEIISEDITANIFIDEQSAGQVSLVNGQGSFDLEAIPGTYQIRIEAPLCAAAELEVTVQ